MSRSDIAEVAAFLQDADLTVSGLHAPSVHLWFERDDAHRIVGTTGFELSPDGSHALIRSVAVRAPARRSGRGTALARFAIERAAEAGATTVWLFSRRSGPFWQRLGFTAADRTDLARALAGTHQVELFQATGQLDREVAWSRPLVPTRTAGCEPPKGEAPPSAPS
jgi:N-acetylglutamate synthase-like GNAT family acetyltransferase